MMVTQRTGRGVSLALGSLAILAVMPVISNSRPEAFSALGFAFYLSVWQTIFAIPLFVRELLSIHKGVFSAALDVRQTRRGLIVALITGIMFGLSTYLYVLGVEKAGATSAAIAIQAYPVFAILWETVFLKKGKTPTEIALTALLIAALYYLGTGGSGRIDGFSFWFLLALGVPFLWSIAHVIIKEELGRMPITPAQVTFFRVSISSVFLAIVVAIIEPSAFLSGIVRPEFLAYAVVMGAVYYAELIVWFYAVRHIDVSLASSITTPWPAFTMILAAIVLGDRIQAYQVAAFFVVAVSIYLLILAGLRKERLQSRQESEVS